MCYQGSAPGGSWLRVAASLRWGSGRAWGSQDTGRAAEAGLSASLLPGPSVTPCSGLAWSQGSGGGSAHGQTREGCGRLC